MVHVAYLKAGELAAGMLPGQEKVSKFYNGNTVQIVVACLIGANFLTNVIEKEIDPHGVKHSDLFGAFGLFYNICFTLELAINIYSHWFRQFWKSNWNIFDVVVVAIGILTTLPLSLPPAFGLLRMMRAFRVFRLFKRVHSLNKIIVAIMHAVPGVANAFLILFIVMSIYSILAVEFYMDIGADCLLPEGDHRWRSARGYCAGDEYFGTFTRSLYTFFQVLTGESWSEMVARTAIWFYIDDPIRAIGGGFFFVSYVLFSSFVLTNVVVAVLLDKMVDPEVAEATMAGIEAAEAEEDDAAGRSSVDSDAAEGALPKVEVPVLRTPDDINNAMISLTTEVEQQVEFSERMSSELDNFRSSMAAMKEQMANIIQSVPGATENNREK